MSKNITFQHTLYSKKIERGTVVEHEESLIDGDKGLTFKVFDKRNGTIEKYVGRLNDDDTFSVIHIVDDKKYDETYSFDDMLKEVKKIDSLAFVYDYLKDFKKSRKQKGGVKKRSRKGSKSSRKSSRRSSRRR